jgi:hypothetical protein
MTFNSIAIRHIYSGKNKLSFTMCCENMKETLPDLYYSYADISNPSWLTDDFSMAQSWDSTTQNLEPLKINEVNMLLQNIVDPNDGQTKTAHVQFPGNIISTSRFYPVGIAMLEYLNRPSAQYFQQCNGEGVGWSATVNSATVPTHPICDNQMINESLHAVGYTTNSFKGLAAFDDGAGYYGSTYILRADVTRPHFGWWDLKENGAYNNGRNWWFGDRGVCAAGIGPNTAFRCRASTPPGSAFRSRLYSAKTVK